MHAVTTDRRDYTFVIGLFAGACLGAGLALWLVPKAASEMRERVADSAKAVRKRAASGYREAGACLDDTVGDLTDRVQGVRDDLADAVVRGARKVEHLAKAAKSS